jgi:hypothetical protein
MPKALSARKAELAGWALIATFGVAAVAAAPVTAQAQASTSAQGPQSSVAGGVTVKVVPRSLGSADNRWEFSVVLDTQSTDLNDDLAQSATLTTSDGRTLKPSGWTGAAAGGHHREGVLSFDIPGPRPTAVELRITRPGESAPRSFRWQP